MLVGMEEAMSWVAGVDRILQAVLVLKEIEVTVNHVAVSE